ncbi:citrate lyase ACP [bacterium]|nr:citrate lyase ACP [bacterium]
MMTVAKASAGRRGASVRSDVYIEIERRDAGGIEWDIRSKVDAFFSDTTRKLLADGLDQFGIEHARVTVEDQGALPFVIMSRLEAVVRRLVPDKTVEPWLPEAESAKEESDRKRPRRSRLYLPGNEPKFMLNAPLHQPDALILDLEDSVAPSEKDAARILVRNALIHLNFQSCEAMVRINQGELGLEDLAFIVPYGVQLVLIPKVEDASQVSAVVEEIERLSRNHDRDEPVWLMPIIESAKGAWFGYEIASAHDTVVALAIGLEDYTADIGAQRTNEGRESFWARSQVVNAARAAGVQPIDTVFSDVSDMDALMESVQEAKSLGFEGKGCIHPRQIEVVHRGFAPSSEEIAKAKKIVLAFEEADRQGLGVVSLGSKMIDPPVVKRALRTVSLAEMDGLLSPDWREE